MQKTPPRFPCAQSDSTFARMSRPLNAGELVMRGYGPCCAGPSKSKMRMALLSPRLPIHARPLEHHDFDRHDPCQGLDLPWSICPNHQSRSPKLGRQFSSNLPSQQSNGDAREPDDPRRTRISRTRCRSMPLVDCVRHAPPVQIRSGSRILGGLGLHAGIVSFEFETLRDSRFLPPRTRDGGS